MIAFSADHREALTEIVNIGFGRSMASLAELLQVVVTLTVPEAGVVQADEVFDFLETSFGGDTELSLVQQTFSGEFFGEAALALPSTSSQILANLLYEQSNFESRVGPDKLELEVLLEIGNVVVGACLGKFADLLKTELSFDPPEIFWEHLHADRFRHQLNTSHDEVLLIRTHFIVNDQQATGYLMIFLSSFCVEWLCDATERFLEEWG